MSVLGRDSQSASRCGWVGSRRLKGQWLKMDREVLELILPFVEDHTALVDSAAKFKHARFYYLLASYGGDMARLIPACEELLDNLLSARQHGQCNPIYYEYTTGGVRPLQIA